MFRRPVATTDGAEARALAAKVLHPDEARRFRICEVARVQKLHVREVLDESEAARPGRLAREAVLTDADRRLAEPLRHVSLLPAPQLEGYRGDRLASVPAALRDELEATLRRWQEDSGRPVPSVELTLTAERVAVGEVRGAGTTVLLGLDSQRLLHRSDPLPSAVDLEPHLPSTWYRNWARREQERLWRMQAAWDRARERGAWWTYVLGRPRPLIGRG